MEFPLYKKIASLAAALALTSTVAAQAATAVSSLQADLPVQTTCSISSTTNFNFAPIGAGLVTSSETATGGLAYTCAGSTVSGLTLADATGGGGAFTLTNAADSSTIPFNIAATSTGAAPLTASPFLDNTQNTAETNATDTITFTATLAPTATTTATTGQYNDTITATLNFT
jgi:spore coat protein U-like protein